MTVVQAGSCSSDSTPSLETSICLGYTPPAKKKKKKKKKNKKNKKLWCELKARHADSKTTAGSREKGRVGERAEDQWQVGWAGEEAADELEMGSQKG